MRSLNNYKTPLRYPGGKSKAMKYLFHDTKLPPNIQEITQYRDAFGGGGSPALAFARLFPNIPIHINDKYQNLYYFWITLQSNPEQLVNILKKKKESVGDDVDKSRELFNEMKSEIGDQTDPFEVGWRWYAMNRMSFSGLTESGTMSTWAMRDCFSFRVIESLIIFGKIIKNWKITNLDYSELIDDDPNVFLFLDPPYDIKDSLYGKDGSMHKGFNHREFYEKVSKSGNTCMITYNSNPTLREWYSEWTQEEWDLTYTMNNQLTSYVENQKKRKELLLMNYKSNVSTLDEFL
jgi:DNA adenine methylase